MGLMRGIGAIGTLGRAARDIGEVFVPNATKGQRLEHAAQRAALEQLGAEFALERRSLFDRCVDGLNRLPRPMLALGTLGLFVYAMSEPAGFSARMQGLAHVPEPLWWLLGAIVGFYFGAREMHYVRRPTPPPPLPAPRMSAWHAPEEDADPPAAIDNPALHDWRGDRD
ncbi:holin family protein [Jannaschia sp. S6380]|uniref:holin family protein n=1 Tax=Jannaschia sp. S6380 TaxID=2926408 RepID=UPI001FF52DC1|nr:holin family protein [Jannaschia sp. S6380]MCK0166907.1 holin family protein [Jannaschia sp. S6380]